LDYKIKYTKQAVSELNKAYSWYRSKESDLGERFKNTFRKIKINLKENPKIFKEVGTNHRRAILSSSFPYKVHYLVDDKTRIIKIIGIFHQSKNMEMVNEKIKIRKIYEEREQKPISNRMNQLKKLRKKQELEKDKGRERGF